MYAWVALEVRISRRPSSACFAYAAGMSRSELLELRGQALRRTLFQRLGEILQVTVAELLELGDIGPGLGGSDSSRYSSNPDLKTSWSSCSSRTGVRPMVMRGWASMKTQWSSIAQDRQVRLRRGFVEPVLAVRPSAVPEDVREGDRGERGRSSRAFRLAWAALISETGRPGPARTRRRSAADLAPSGKIRCTVRGVASARKQPAARAAGCWVGRFRNARRGGRVGQNAVVGSVSRPSARLSDRTSSLKLTRPACSAFATISK